MMFVVILNCYICVWNCLICIFFSKYKRTLINSLSVDFDIIIKMPSKSRPTGGRWRTSGSSNKYQQPTIKYLLQIKSYLRQYYQDCDRFVMVTSVSSINKIVESSVKHIKPIYINRTKSQITLDKNFVHKG